MRSQRAGSPSTTVRRVARFRPSVADAALTLACIALMHLEIPLNDKAVWSVAGSVAIVAASLPVLARRAAPVTAYVVAFVLMLGIIQTVSVYNTLAFPVVILARFVAVAVPVTLMRRRRPFTRGAISILTWGGLRGGVSVALALSIPAHLPDGTPVPEQAVVLSITYVVVVVSIVGQGLTIGPLLRRRLMGR